MADLTTKQVAERLGLEIRTVQKYVTAGRFPNAHKPGRDWLVPETDLEGFTPPGNGRPRHTTPSPAALYKRARRSNVTDQS